MALPRSLSFLEPLFIRKTSGSTTPAIAEPGTPSGFGVMRSIAEGLGRAGIPFLPETSPARYFPGQLAKSTFEAAVPQTPQEVPLQFAPLGLALKPLAKTSIGKIATIEIGKGIEIVAPQVFKGFKDLSTKLLEKLKGRDVVSRQFISDLTNAPELKQQERNVIRNVLESQKGDQIPIQEFADKVKSELLPLKMKPSLQYADYNYIPNELKGNIANAKTHIWESPIKTSAGEKHQFGRETQNYFGHTRIEDMAPSGIKIDPSARPNLTQANKGTTRRVVEVQNDLYQKGGLEREFNHKNLPYEDFKKIPIGRERTKIAQQLRDKQTNKLSQYNDPTAHFRMVREEIKQAAIEGKTKLQFPTGETVMKIEGLGERPSVWRINEVPESKYGGRNIPDLNAPKLTPINMKVGQTIHQGTEGSIQYEQHEAWVITDVLGDGKFKAVQKSQVNPNTRDWGTAITEKDLSPILVDGKQMYYRTDHLEQFDISGKVDISNPIFRFYEKDLGSYLRNRHGAKLVTDNKGVTWWELDIKPEQGKLPVEAFGVLPFMGLQQDEENNRRRIFQSTPSIVK